MITFTDYQNLATAVSAYAQEAWHEGRLLQSTGIVSQSSSIDTTGEGFTGQMRWYKPFQPVVNTPSFTVATAGSFTGVDTDLAAYIKSLRAIGTTEQNLQKVISRQDGIAWFASQLAGGRARDENAALHAILRGVAASEAAVGAGIVNFNTMPGAATGAFVDINAAGYFGAAATNGTDERKLINSAEMGAAQGERLFQALGMFWKQNEPDYAYLLLSPETLAEIRGANLIEEDRVTDGNLSFQTIFGGKFRLVLTQNVFGDLSAEPNVNPRSTKTTFVVRPGALAFHEVDIPVPTELGRDASAYNGGGTTHMWYRYGFVAHPMGYDWVGATNVPAQNTDMENGASWVRKVDPLNLPILPIFHS